MARELHVVARMAVDAMPVPPAEQTDPAATDGKAASQQRAAGTLAQVNTVSTSSKRALRQQERKDYTEAAQAAVPDSDTDSDPAPKRPRLAPGRQVLQHVPVFSFLS